MCTYSSRLMRTKCDHCLAWSGAVRLWVVCADSANTHVYLPHSGSHTRALVWDLAVASRASSSISGHREREKKKHPDRSTPTKLKGWVRVHVLLSVLPKQFGAKWGHRLNLAGGCSQSKLLLVVVNEDTMKMESLLMRVWEQTRG